MEAEYRAADAARRSPRCRRTSTPTRWCRRRRRSCWPAPGTRRCSTWRRRASRARARSCHGDQAQGLIGPNLTDDRWIHGGSVEQIFQTVAKGWPSKGMPPWGRTLEPEELAALVSYVRSLQGIDAAESAARRRRPFAPEPLPDADDATVCRERCRAMSPRTTGLRGRAARRAALQPLGRRQAPVHAPGGAQGALLAHPAAHRRTPSSCCSSRCRSFRSAAHPAVLLDLATRRFHLFGATFHPTDNLLLAAFGFGVIVTVFFVGSTFGRVWCGFGCPQTIYLEFLFRPDRSADRGRAHQSAAPEQGAVVGAQGPAIKATKWLSVARVGRDAWRRRSSPTSPAGRRSRTACRPSRWPGRGAAVHHGRGDRPHRVRLRLVPRPDVHDRLSRTAACRT